MRRLVVTDPERRALLDRLHAAAGVRTRHLALPLEEYGRLESFTAANDVFLDVGTTLAEQAITSALRAAGLVPEDVDMLLSATVTGVAAPSIDARLVPRLGMRPD